MGRVADAGRYMIIFELCLDKRSATELFCMVEFQVAVIYYCYASSEPEPNKTID
jgi:hypothetical protein